MGRTQGIVRVRMVSVGRLVRESSEEVGEVGDVGEGGGEESRD